MLFNIIRYLTEHLIVSTIDGGIYQLIGSVVQVEIHTPALNACDFGIAGNGDGDGITDGCLSLIYRQFQGRCFCCESRNTKIHYQQQSQQNASETFCFHCFSPFTIYALLR